MWNVVFEWMEDDGANQQVCTSYGEVVEFVNNNQGRTYKVHCWEE